MGLTASNFEQNYICKVSKQLTISFCASHGCPLFFMKPCFGRQAIKFGAHYHKNNKTQQTLRLSVPSRRILRKIFPLFRRSLNSGFRTGEAAFLQTLIRKRKSMYRHHFFKSRLISPNFSIYVLTEFRSHSKKSYF